MRTWLKEFINIVVISSARFILAKFKTDVCKVIKRRNVDSLPMFSADRVVTILTFTISRRVVSYRVSSDSKIEITRGRVQPVQSFILLLLTVVSL